MNWLFNVTINDISVTYMWRHIDVQADWRKRWIYGRTPNAIDISKHRHGITLFIRWFRHTAPFSRLLQHAGDTDENQWPYSFCQYLIRVQKMLNICSYFVRFLWCSRWFYNPPPLLIWVSVLLYLRLPGGGGLLLDVGWFVFILCFFPVGTPGVLRWE